MRGTIDGALSALPLAPTLPTMLREDPFAQQLCAGLDEVLALDRVSEGMLASTFRLTNRAGTPANLQQEFFERSLPNPYNGATLSGLRLVDAAASKDAERKDATEDSDAPDPVAVVAETPAEAIADAEDDADAAAQAEADAQGDPAATTPKPAEDES